MPCSIVSVYYYQGQGHQGNLCQSPRGEVIIFASCKVFLHQRQVLLTFFFPWNGDSHPWKATCSDAPRLYFLLTLYFAFPMELHPSNSCEGCFIIPIPM